MPPKMKRPTAAEVARRSGVSTATVSYVLNQTPGQRISELTRERVLGAAREIGYVPNGYAQALASGSSRVVVIDLSEVPFGDNASRLARAVADEFEARGYLPIIDQPERSAGDSHRRLIALGGMMAPQVVVTVTPLGAALRSRLHAMGVERFASVFEQADAVSEGTRALTREQIRYLSTRGHTSIAYCGTDEVHLAEFDETRRKVFVAECEALGLSWSDLGSDRNPTAIATALQASRRSNSPPSAVAAYNDEVALAALSAANHLGLDVPRELAVIGIDDTALAPLCVPPLTSVALVGDNAPRIQDLFEIFDRGGEVLIPGRQVPRVVARESA